VKEVNETRLNTISFNPDSSSNQNKKENALDKSLDYRSHQSLINSSFSI